MQANKEALADVGLKYMVLYALSFDKNRQMGGLNHYALKVHRFLKG
jgi:hypothetical protein